MKPKRDLKIALCFAGEFRYPEYGRRSIDFIKKIQSTSIVDTFIHTWEDVTYKAKGTNPPGTDPLDNRTSIRTSVDDLEGYTPIRYSLQNKAALDPIIEDYELSHLANSIKYTGWTSISQMYSYGQVHKLRMEYEKENNFVYDLVFQIRTDLLLNPTANNHYSSKKNLFNVFTKKPAIWFPQVSIVPGAGPSTIKVRHNTWLGPGSVMNTIFEEWDLKTICNVRRSSSRKNIDTRELEIDYKVQKSEIGLGKHILSLNIPILMTQIIPFFTVQNLTRSDENSHMKYTC